MTKHEVRHIGKGMKPYDRGEVEKHPTLPRAVWATWPRYGEAVVEYHGRVLDPDEREVQRCAHRHASRDEAQACADAMLAERVVHVVEGRTWHEGTERYEVFALCGAGEEASGSGWHGLVVGSRPCPRCAEIEARRDPGR
jgi:hypothetical protein